MSQFFWPIWVLIRIFKSWLWENDNTHSEQLSKGLEMMPRNLFFGRYEFWYEFLSCGYEERITNILNSWRIPQFASLNELMYGVLCFNKSEWTDWGIVKKLSWNVKYLYLHINEADNSMIFWRCENIQLKMLSSFICKFNKLLVTCCVCIKK